MENKVLLLVGGGHAHVYLINEIINQKQDFKTILVSSNRFQFYSGMASAYIENIYSDEDIAFDLEKLCQMGDIEFYQNKVVKIDPENKNVTLDNGKIIYFDVASFDTGSELKMDEKYKNKDFITGIKPLTNLKKIKDNLRSSNLKNPKILIVGAGAAGTELSLALKEFGKQIGKDLDIHVVDRGKVILSSFDPRVQKIAMEALEKEGITLHMEGDIEQITNTSVFDFIFWAGGPTSNPMYKNAGIPVDEKGYMLVNNYLQSISYPFIFGSGDCIAFKEYKYVIKIGVYAIREAPYLWKNISNYFKKLPLKSYIPQKNYLLIISLGRKRAILYYKGFVAKGSFEWLIKNHIDTSFMKRFQTYRK